MELNKQPSVVLNKLMGVGQLVFFCLELNQDRHTSESLHLDCFPRVFGVVLRKTPMDPEKDRIQWLSEYKM